MNACCICPRDVTGMIEVQPHCPVHGPIDAEFIEAHQAVEEDAITKRAFDIAALAVTIQSTRLERIVCALLLGRGLAYDSKKEAAVDLVAFADEIRRAIEIRESDPDFNKYG